MKKIIIVCTIFAMSLFLATALAGDDWTAEKARETANKKAALGKERKERGQVYA